MSDNQPITLPQDEFAAYQKAIESAKDRIAVLTVECARLEASRAAFARSADAWRERALCAEADAQALRTAALAYVTSATYEDRERLRAELYVLATVDHPGTLLTQELKILRELDDDLTRWRDAGGDIRDLAYVFETMDRYQAMKEGGE